MNKDEFMKRMLFMERVKKVREGRNKDRESKNYRSERMFESNKGKQIHIEEVMLTTIDRHKYKIKGDDLYGKKNKSNTKKL